MERQNEEWLRKLDRKRLLLVARFNAKTIEQDKSWNIVPAESSVRNLVCAIDEIIWRECNEGADEEIKND